MWLVLTLTVPLFYIIGLIVSIRWLVRHGGSTHRTRSDKQYVADELRLRASAHKGKVKDELLAVAEALEQNLGYVPATVPDDHAEGTFITDQIGADGQIKPEARKQSTSSWADADVRDIFASMDNINLLLFLGAFLIVVSAGIFVGFNFQTLSGIAKVAFLFAFTAAFYLAGLILYVNSPKLRPAGSTFTGIGLVLMPFVGVAAYNFTGAHSHGAAVWLITSLVALALYVITLATTRQTYIAYLMAACTLSLFESAVSLVQLPIYWFGWVGAIVAVILMVLPSTRKLWRDAAFALKATAHAFIPISLLFSLWLAGDQGLGQFGITAALAGFFYLMLMLRERDHAMADHYFAAAAFALPIAVGSGLWDSFPRATVAGLMLLIAACSLVAVALYEKVLTPWPTSTRRMTLAILAGGLPIAAVAMDAGSARMLAAGLAGVVVMNAALAVILSQVTYALIAELAALFLPLVLFEDLLTPHATAGQMAVIYGALALILFAWRHTMRRWAPPKDMTGIAGYGVGLVATFVAAAMSGHVPLVITGLLVAAGLFAASYYENAAEFVYLAAASLYIAAVHVVAASHWYVGAYSIAIAGLGIVMYAASPILENDAARARALCVAGLIGTYLAAIIGLSGQMGNAPAAALAAAAALTYMEGLRRQNSQYRELAVAVALLALDWLLANGHFTQTQLYSLPWAAYFAVLAWRRRTDASARDIFVLLALATLTFPIAGQALDTGGQWYGLELILVAIVIAYAGSTIRYKLALWWGVATLVAEVLYQMRSVLFALPKYAISAVLGLALLAAAIVLLQRRRQE